MQTQSSALRLSAALAGMQFDGCQASERFSYDMTNAIKDKESSSKTVLAAGRMYDIPVTVKIGFPTYAGYSQQGFVQEIEINQRLNALMEKRFSPHLAAYIGSWQCSVGQVLAALSSEADKQKFTAQIDQIAQQTQSERLSLDDPCQLLVTQAIGAYSLYSYLVDPQPRLREQEIIALLFQIIWTANILAEKQIRHGDLSCQNVLVSRVNSKLAYIMDPPAAGDPDAFLIEAPVMAHIANWHFGSAVGISNPRADAFCRETSSCGVDNDKADIFTVLSEIWRRMREHPVYRNYSQVIEFIESCIDRDLLSFFTKRTEQIRWPYRLCDGPFANDCNRVAKRVNPAAKCTGPWRPADCLVKSPKQMLHQPKSTLMRPVVNQSLFKDYVLRQPRKALGYTTVVETDFVGQLPIHGYGTVPFYGNWPRDDEKFVRARYAPPSSEEYLSRIIEPPASARRTRDTSPRRPGSK